MSNNHILTNTGNAFLILYPQELTPDLAELNELIPPADKDAIYISADNWLFYQPVAEDDIYSWEIPGIKLVFNGDIKYDEAKEFAERIVSTLKKGSGMEITLVAVDKTKLTSKSSDQL